LRFCLNNCCEGASELAGATDQYWLKLEASTRDRQTQVLYEGSAIRGCRRSRADSAIGLSTMVAIGPDHFRAMLEGFHAIDDHFCTAPFARNLPVLMGVLGVWYNDFFGAQTVAVLP
jgi:glucose-6-phosphate isomerase